MRFTKMHGLGNDYVYVNGFTETVDDPQSVARAVSDRHFGIGSDGLILILPSKVADVRMRMFNIEGTEGEMCGNGIRCVAKYAFDHGLTRSNPMRVETGRGILSLELDIEGGKVEGVKVDMLEPILDLLAVPFDPTKARPTRDPFAFDFDLGGELIRGVPVSTGNPHVVFFVDDVAAIDLARVGPQAERHASFPRRVNAHWVEVLSRGEVRMRTWERGSGITQACGTGACAVVVAGVLERKLDRNVLVHLPGGDLNIEWNDHDQHLYMTGPATEVFSGEWNGSA